MARGQGLTVMEGLVLRVGGRVEVDDLAGQTLTIPGEPDVRI